MIVLALAIPCSAKFYIHTHEKQQKQKSQLVRLIDSSAISLAFIRLLQKCMEFWILAFWSKTFDLGWELEPQSLLSSKCTESKISILKRSKMAKFQYLVYATCPYKKSLNVFVLGLVVSHSRTLLTFFRITIPSVHLAYIHEHPVLGWVAICWTNRKEIIWTLAFTVDVHSQTYCLIGFHNPCTCT